MDIAIAVTIREEVISSPYFETLSAPNYLNKDISRISNLSKPRINSGVTVEVSSGPMTGCISGFYGVNGTSSQILV